MISLSSIAANFCETSEELRVLVSEQAGRLPTTDRALIERAATEIDDLTRQLLATQSDLINANQRRTALQERLFEAEKSVRHVPLAPWHTFYGAVTWR